MIRADKSDGRGYVRCGQAELEQGNASAALEWYEHGIKRVSPSSQYFATISAAAGSTREQIRLDTVNSRPVDPMQTLPIELVQKFLSLLPYRQHIKMLRVCKAWNRLLRSMSPLTDTLAFPSPTKDINTKMLHAALRRLTRPTAVRVDHLQQAASDLLADRMRYWQNWQNLAVLEVEDKRFAAWNLPLPKFDLRTIKLHPESIPFAVVQQILQDCPKLETAIFSQVLFPSRPQADGLTASPFPHIPVLHGDNLRQLHISARPLSEPMPLNITNLFDRMLRLESLGLAKIWSGFSFDLRHLKRLQHLSLRDFRTPEISLPASLKSLEIFLSSIVALVEPTDSFPRLQSIQLETFKAVGCESLPDFLFISIATENIAKFTWMGTTRAQYENMLCHLIEIGRFKGVRDLHLQTGALSDSLGPGFATGLPSLETLVIEESQITGAFISDLIEANNKLHKVTLVQCPKVSSDIVAWSKARGVHVKRLNSTKELTGKRVIEEI
ncbi:hypothetical protein LTS17_012167 [Exophiala oligosperma]